VGRVHTRPADPDTYAHPAWKGGLSFEPRFDYSGDGILKSYEMSLARLGLNRVEALLIHDLDPGHLRTENAVAEALAVLDKSGFQALVNLKAGGEVLAIGAGINRTGMISRFLDRFPVDFFLVAMPYTLLDQSGLEELDLCRAAGVSVVIGAPFASGILAVGPQAGATYGYRTARPDVMAKAASIQAVCARHNVPMAAAALQFPFGHASVVSVIPGPNAPEQVRTNLARMRTPLPTDLWRELQDESLIRAEAPVPEAAA
jgi:D-threo-aldose 1-dehydrogenase